MKSFFSVGASRVDGPGDLPDAFRRASLPGDFYVPFDVLLERYAGAPLGPRRVIVEECVPGVQATFEGCVAQGRMLPIGVVDSVLHPGTMAFERFEYPSRLPSRDSRSGWPGPPATGGAGELEYDDGLFNIEFIYDQASDRLWIIVINPRNGVAVRRMVYVKVDGFNSYDVLLDVALGSHSPVIPSRDVVRARLGAKLCVAHL